MKKGFSLIELLIVIVIITILCLIAYTNYFRYMNNQVYDLQQSQTIECNKDPNCIKIYCTKDYNCKKHTLDGVKWVHVSG